MELDYEQALEQKVKENEKYFDLFLDVMKKQGLSDKVIKRHLTNSKFYVNEYLNHYQIENMEEGLDKVSDFFGYYFIYKCLFSTSNSFKEMLASISKFYKVMNANGLVDKVSYQTFRDTIKISKDEWLEELKEYNYGEK